MSRFASSSPAVLVYICNILNNNKTYVPYTKRKSQKAVHLPTDISNKKKLLMLKWKDEVLKRKQSDEIPVSSSCKFALYNRLTIRGAFLSPPDRGKTFLLSTSSRPVPGLTQFPIQWVSGIHPPGVKRPRCEADN
jgi:hypothetical protein